MKLFDRARPFYPLVMQYSVFLIGVKEIAARYEDDEQERLESFRKRVAHQPNCDEQVRNMHDLLGPLMLASSVSETLIEVVPAEVAQEVRENAHFFMSSVSAGHVLVLAHELCKGHPANDKGPLWEFLRHCRNAVSHGGKFKFDRDEPTRPAVWHCHELKPEMQGMLLFRGMREQGLLLPGDPIALLWEIEQLYPNLT